MKVFWLEQTEADVPADDDWLCANEALRLRGMHFVKRRADWRLGRWTAKHAVAIYLGWPAETHVFNKIEIRQAPSGAPEIVLAGRPTALGVSLSHRDGTAMCAISALRTALGCDLEVIEPRSDAFIADYFTSEEQVFVECAPTEERATIVALLWSAKESALKALRQGLRLDTRSVVVTLGVSEDNLRACSEDAAQASQSCDFRYNGWRAVDVRYASGDRLFHGWWQNKGGLVRTVIADPPPLPPVFLTSGASSFKGMRLLRT